mmetsp:Transcript_9054/g.12537  ORF Transcript_9054/g.12537 Transcript_9054/m.12537 type:complete len:90 (-) Transcript_9054:100-369(-)
MKNITRIQRYLCLHYQLDAIDLFDAIRESFKKSKKTDSLALKKLTLQKTQVFSVNIQLDFGSVLFCVDPQTTKLWELLYIIYKNSDVAL